ncbi:MAG TPA: nucleotidyl transferase AbiEii/AbiGii toxin family protein [Polyangia bacterium]
MSALQRDLLVAFFEREARFFLTGGAALGGFHLGHRPSDDIDLFTTPPVDLDAGERALLGAAAACGATLVPVDRFPEFRRFLAERGAERTVVDLVLDRAPQLDATKGRVGSIRMDSLLEIAANKICALLSRNEAKDLVDLTAILEAGVSLEGALAAAGRKDAGANAANLGFVLDQVRIGAAAVLPGGGDPLELERARVRLVAELARLAFPGPHR